MAIKLKAASEVVPMSPTDVKELLESMLSETSTVVKPLHLSYVVVGVNSAATSKSGSDYTRIIVAGKNVNDQFTFGRFYSP